MRRLLASVAVVAALLLPGCLDPTSVGSSLTCTDLEARRPSGNARLTPTLRLPAEEVARRLAHAVGDEWVGPTAREPVAGTPGEMWGTRDGWIEWFAPRAGQEWGLLRYWRDGLWTPIDEEAARSAFTAAMAALEIPPSAYGEVEVEVHREAYQHRVDGRSVPAFEGQPLAQDPGARFWVADDVQNRSDPPDRSQLELHPMYELRHARATLSFSEAQHIALKAVECRLRDSGEWDVHRGTLGVSSDGPRFAVERDSLGYAVGVGYGESCDEQRLVHLVVDAVSGALLRVDEPGAGCVY